MVITEVRIKLVEENNERLQAFCSVTFDNAFVVRDLKIIEGTKGSFVAMPSRKLTDRCPRAGARTTCGPGSATSAAPARREPRHARRRRPGQAPRRHRPPDQLGCREVIQNAVIKSYHGGARTGQAARLRLHLRRLRRRRLRRAELRRRDEPRHGAGARRPRGTRNHMQTNKARRAAMIAVPISAPGSIKTSRGAEEQGSKGEKSACSSTPLLPCSLAPRSPAHFGQYLFASMRPAPFHGLFRQDHAVWKLVGRRGFNQLLADDRHFLRVARNSTALPKLVGEEQTHRGNHACNHVGPVRVDLVREIHHRFFDLVREPVRQEKQKCDAEDGVESVGKQKTCDGQSQHAGHDEHRRANAGQSRTPRSIRTPYLWKLPSMRSRVSGRMSQRLTQPTSSRRGPPARPMP